MYIYIYIYLIIIFKMNAENKKIHEHFFNDSDTKNYKLVEDNEKNKSEKNLKFVGKIVITVIFLITFIIFTRIIKEKNNYKKKISAMVFGIANTCMLTSIVLDIFKISMPNISDIFSVIATFFYIGYASYASFIYNEQLKEQGQQQGQQQKQQGQQQQKQQGPQVQQVQQQGPQQGKQGPKQGQGKQGNNNKQQQTTTNNNKK